MAAYQVIYSSAATLAFTEHDLSTLLLRARANNERLGVTGLLLHHHGSFLQVLEGDQNVLDSLFRTISLDKRHNRVVRLLGRVVEERQFGEWKMGFVAMTVGAKSLPGFSDFLRSPDREAAASAAERVLSSFREGRFRAAIAG